jgi:dihydroflavonol-4-reductase
MLLVTGATGFLGGRLVRLLRELGHEVRATGRPGDSKELLEGLGCEWMPADLQDRPAVERLLAGVTDVFHVAGLVTFRPELYTTQLKVNVEGTRNLLQAGRDAKIRRFIYTSTINTLGIPATGQVGDEDTPFNWGPWRLGYMDSKHAAETLVVEAAAAGMDTVCLLPGTMFGPGDILKNAGMYILQAAKGRMLIAPAGGTTVVHVDDVARGHLLAWQRGKTSGRYILGGEHLDYRTLYTWITEELGRRPPLVTLPRAIVHWTGRQAGRLRRFLKLPIPFNEGVAVAATAELYYSSALAERELGYHARPARESIRDAVDWYRQRGWI